MPEPTENPERDIASDFEDWLNDRAVEPGGVTVRDLDMMEAVICVRLRSVLTFQQLHVRAHHIIQYAENLLQTPGSLIDEFGNEADPMLVENFQGTPEELVAMLSANVQPLEDADLIALLEEAANSEGEEE